jgi:CubicO group peptidase (beta-lactamase class C family)
MHRNATRLGIVFFFLFFISTSAIAQQKPASTQSPVAPNASNEEAIVKRVVDRIMQPYLSQAGIPGAIVGVSLHGHRYFFPYGKATDAGAPFTPDTLVEIGSCTKTFTTTLFSLALNRKQMVADDSAQKYMPSGFTLKSPAQLMTPLELADFTSGLPDDPTNLPRGLEQRSIEHYTTKDFLTWVSGWEPATKLPAPYLYSNAGVGLLSYLVMTATSKQWEEQLNTEILQPLTMPDTELRPTPEQMKRMAKGHRANGQDAPPWPIFAWYAAGGLRSTARDMISFGEANLGHKEVNGKPVSADLTAAMQLAQKPIYTLPSGRSKQAMAWVNNLGNGGPNLHPVIVKNGGTVGFVSVIAISPYKDLAVFVVVNQVGANPTPKGIEIVRQMPVAVKTTDSPPGSD